VIPKAVTKRIISNVKQVALGQSIDLETSRQRMIEYFNKLGVTKEQLFFYLNITKLEEIDIQMVFELRATANAIKEGTTSVQETFVQPMLEAKKREEGMKQATEAQKKAEEALAKATGTDTATGELFDTTSESTSKKTKSTTKK
jgi:hypothetical protein